MITGSDFSGRLLELGLVLVSQPRRPKPWCRMSLPWCRQTACGMLNLKETKINHDLEDCSFCGKLFARSKRNTSPALEWADRWKLLWCWPGFGLALLLYLHDIHLFDPKKWIYFELLRGRGCVESKNMTSAERISIMSSVNPSIIQVGSFKCRADVPLLKQ